MQQYRMGTTHCMHVIKEQYSVGSDKRKVVACLNEIENPGLSWS